DMYWIHQDAYAARTGAASAISLGASIAERDWIVRNEIAYPWTGDSTEFPGSVTGDNLDNAFLFDISTEAGAAYTYKMRGRDDGASAPGYVTWKSSIADYTGVDVGTSVPSLVGSLIPGSVIVIGKY
ncbi:MAG: hypothetical protein ACWGQW_21785, partial [bacterium]